METSSAVPPFQQKPRGSNKTSQRKQTSRDRNKTRPCSGVASFTQKEMEGRRAVVLLAHAEADSWPQLSWQIPCLINWMQRDQAAYFSITTITWPKSLILLFCRMPMRILSPSLFQRGETHSGPENKHQRLLCMTYYIMDIQAQCMATIIPHLEAVAVVKWWFTMSVFSITYQCGGGVGGGWWD